MTNLNAVGIPDIVAPSITGHRSLAVFKRYGIKRESVQRVAMERTEQYLAALGGGTGPTRRDRGAA